MKNDELMTSLNINIDHEANPCEDFYQYSCGGWLKNNTIPDDKSRWGSFNALADRNRDQLKELLSSGGNGKASVYYASCLDQKGIDALGGKPLLELMASLPLEFSKNPEGAWTEADYTNLATALARMGHSGVQVFFGVGVGPDSEDSNVNIVGISQGGLSLPGREYYLNKSLSDPMLQSLQKHIKKSFVLLDGQCADSVAENIVRFEQALAEIMWDKIKMRDPVATTNKMPISALQTHSQHFPWNEYFKVYESTYIGDVDVATPSYFEKLEKVLETAGKKTVQDYLRWSILTEYIPHLSTPFYDEAFDMDSKLSGAKVKQARWETCVSRTDSAFMHLVSKMYVDSYFSSDSKTIGKDMISGIRKSFVTNLDSNDWMDSETKERAKAKANAINEKIGFPSRLENATFLQEYYADHLVEAGGNNYFKNHVLTIQAGVKRNIDKLGKPVDRLEWQMSSPTVNAYYDPSKNEIVFPAGILQQPFFDKGYQMAFNYGAIGVVMGHELTHGFDDQGSQFDENGNLKSWWKEATRANYEKRTACLADQYSKFVVNGDEHVNGKLTLGENIADNGGVHLAFQAFKTSILSGKTAECPSHQFTADQIFFLGFAQVWCEKERSEALHQSIISDPHSPGFARVNGAVANSEAFDKAFNCPAQSSQKARCSVW